MEMNVETAIQYYGIYFARYDAQSPAQDVLGELRRSYFTNGQRQKNKIARENDGRLCRYAYVLEAGAPLKWKKMQGGRLAERSLPMGDGGYQVQVQGEDKQLVKKMFFDALHRWYRTEYYSSEFRRTPTAVLALGADDSVLLMQEYASDGREKAAYQLYPCDIPRDGGERSLLNGAAGVPEILAFTNRGNYYYCRREEMQRRKTVLEAIRAGNEVPPFFAVDRAQELEENPEEADRVGGFQVSLDTHSATMEEKEPSAILSAEEEEKVFSLTDVQTDLEELKRIRQEVQETLRHSGGLNSYQWSGTVDTEKYLVEEDHVPPAVQEPQEEPEEILDEDAEDSGAVETIHEEKVPEERQEETKIQEEPAQEPMAVQEEPAVPIREEPVQERDYLYAGIAGADDGNAAEALSGMGLSVDERQRLGRYNVIIQPISKNKYARPDVQSELTQEPEEGKAAADAADALEETVLGSGESEIPYRFQEACDGVSTGCPFSGQSKRKISVSDTESYYYFGELVDGQREGNGRTVMANGHTAYEGGYQGDKRDGFGVYYYKTGKLCYLGDWKENRRDGAGIAFRPGERVFQVGHWQENMPQGTAASFDYEANLLYSGEWRDGKRHGTGISRSSEDGSILVGQWEEDVPAGRATQFDAAGNLLYTGGFHNGERCGRGTEYDQDGGIRYTGDWLANRYHGQGTLYREDGHTIKGTFQSGEVCGRAAETDSGGAKVYEGSWENGRYHGTGCKYLPDGGRCEGIFADGEPSGFLKGYTASGELTYSGEWKDWNYHGEGASYAGGEKMYEGSFREGRYCGKGYEYHKGNYVFSGEFREDRRCGFGTSYEQGRPEYIGEWKDNVYHGEGLLYQNGKPRYAGSFTGGKLHGRANTIVDGAVRAEGIYKEGSLIYVRQYTADGCLEYEGSVKAGKPAGMGCTFSPFGEKKEEGIFTDGVLTHGMKVTRRHIEPLTPCERLVNTEYEAYCEGPGYAIERPMGSGVYSGQLIDGKPGGKGTILCDDHRYTGCFEKGEPCGEGIIYRMDGSTLRGRFLPAREEEAAALTFSGGVAYFCRLTEDN